MGPREPRRRQPWRRNASFTFMALLAASWAPGPRAEPGTKAPALAPRGSSSLEPAVAQASARAEADAAPAGLALPRSAVVYSTSLETKVFRHASHAGAAPCAFCHPAAASSARSIDWLGATPAACLGCHRAGEPQVAPARLPPPWPPPSPPGAPTLKFSHKLHVGQGLACGACHSAESLDSPVRAAGLPLMADCLRCHDGKRASAACGACHPTLPDGRLKTDFPSGKLLPSGVWEGDAAHDAEFRTTHGPAARDGRRCETCHTRSFCTSCHSEGVVRPGFLHPANYLDLHAMEARRNIPDCSACHRTQSFCVGCHQRLGVGPDAPGGQRGLPAANPFGTGTGIKTFHPPGWAEARANASASPHALEARRNILGCASCHREESCLACHSTDPSRAAQIDPHGPGFAGSARCRALASRNQRACLKCHMLGAAALSCL